MKIDNDYYQASHQRRGCIFIFITALSRIFGLITLIGLGFLTYVEWVGGNLWNFRIYLTIVTIIVAYLELLWIFDKCITCCLCCFRSETCFYWVCCIPFDNWLKTILYVGLSIPFFVPTWFVSATRTDIKIAGICLIVTGLLYFIKTFKYKKIDSEDDDVFDAPSSIAIQTSSTYTTEQ